MFLLFNIIPPAAQLSDFQKSGSKEFRKQVLPGLPAGAGASGGMEAAAVLPVTPVLTSYSPGSPEKQGQVLEKDNLARIQKTLEKPRRVS